MELLVLDKLGDLVRKSVEIKHLLEKDKENKLLERDLQAHRMLIEEWVRGAGISELIYAVLEQRLVTGMERLRTDEDELRGAVSTGWNAMRQLTLEQYLRRLTEVRNVLGELNRLGGFGFPAGAADKDQLRLEFTP